MAGFFGLFDYTKEGKGVEKNEKEKKGFFRFFEIFFRNFWKFMLVSLTYWATSLLVVTNGFAKVGFTNIVRSTNREKHSFMLADYFEAIKKNWKQALGLGILNAVITAILFLDLWYFYGAVTNPDGGVFAIIGFGVSVFLVLTVTFMKYYIWTMVITFDLKFKQLLNNSFHFVFLNFWRNLLVSVVLGVIYFGLWVLAMLNGFFLLLAIFLALFVLPGFKTSLVQANVFPAIKKFIIDPYYAEHKGEDIEKRLALGLEIPEDELPSTPEENEETIFTDRTEK